LIICFSIKDKFTALPACAVNLLRDVVDFFFRPPRWFEPLVWSLLLAAVIVPRFLMFTVAPSALWSGDAGSFIHPAMQILSGEKDILSKRGAGYILMLITFIEFPQHFFPALAVFQQSIMGGVILGAAVFMRLLLGRSALFFILIFGSGAAFYDVPIFVAHLIRNEALQAFCLMLGMGFLGLAMKKKNLSSATASGVFFALTNLVKATQPLMILFSAALLWWRYRKLKAGWAVGLAAIVGYYAVYILTTLGGVVTGVNFKTRSYAGCELYSQVAHLGWTHSKKYPQISAAIRDEVEKYISLKERNNGYVHDYIISEISRFTTDEPNSYVSVDKICRTLAFEILRTYPLRCAQDFWQKAVIFHTRTGYKSNRPRLSHIREAGFKARITHQELIKQQELLKKFPINFEPAFALENVRKTPEYHFLKSLARMAFPHERFSIVLVTTLLCVILPSCTSGWLRLWCLNMSLAWLFFIVLHTTVSEPKDRFLVPMLSVSLWVCIIGGYQLARTLSKLVGKGDVCFSVQI
jgi:hypothetical protein